MTFQFDLQSYRISTIGDISIKPYNEFEISLVASVPKTTSKLLLLVRVRYIVIGVSNNFTN